MSPSSTVGDSIKFRENFLYSLLCLLTICFAVKQDITFLRFTTVMDGNMGMIDKRINAIHNKRYKQ
ncbi:hypothetical protein I6U48_00885 [Clostridium sp. PL3]|uniref:Uncharacterized protein n=1 Tax=Clostridium thailandense TaxID=2794346 RepID=A0A949WPM5_9CLOT|nr:hypothetical protein [Clostridium thailandense]MBV7271475.1 hypothetical protein [Clostridium thailandense]